MDTLEKLQPEIAENSGNQFSAGAEVSSILSSLHLSSGESITFIEKDRYGIPVASIEIRSIIEKKIKKIDGTIVGVEQKTIWFCDKLKRLRGGNPLSIKGMIEKVIQSAKIQGVHTLRLNALSQPRRTIDGKKTLTQEKLVRFYNHLGFQHINASDLMENVLIPDGEMIKKVSN